MSFAGAERDEDEGKFADLCKGGSDEEVGMFVVAEDAEEEHDDKGFSDQDEE